MTRHDRRSKPAAGAPERSFQDGACSGPSAAAGSERHLKGSAGVAARLEQYARTPAKPPMAPVGAQSPVYEDSLDFSLAACSQGGGEADDGPLQTQSPSLAAAGLSVSEVPAPSPQPDCVSPAAEPTLADVLLAVNKCNCTLATLSTHVGKVQADISFIRHDLQNVRERLSSAEERISTVEDTVHPLSAEIKRHTAAISTLMQKSDDFENRLRRNNLRLIGVPEKAEGSNPTDFFEQWLAQLIGKDRLSPLFAVERAHRVPTRAMPPGAPPRPVLARILHYKDRDTILRAARDIPDIRIDNGKISIFPDFSAEVQRRRLQFFDVKKRLRALQLPYAMLYPARLRVAAPTGSQFFESAKQAVDWLDTHERHLRAAKD